jgi:uracil-DNA glycosylase
MAALAQTDTILATVAAEDDFDSWKDAARGLAAAGVDPAQVVWQVGGGGGDLFAAAAPPPATATQFSVPKAFVSLGQSAILNSDPERFALLYRLLVLVRAAPQVMQDSANPLLRRIEGLAKAVRRDIHKMRAFVRFRAITDQRGEHFIAWFEPEHHIVRANAGFFVRRFANMRWSILTPALSIHWDGETLTEGPPASRENAPSEDAAEAQWKAYYAAIFNPARLKVGAMLKEMPKKYWKNMPETALVPELIAGARARETAMIAAQTPAPPSEDWTAIRAEAMRCKRCPLFGPATQTVFGEGPVDAQLMLVGEQPGDQEDLAGHPFVGPAGQVLDQALQAAGINRSRIYVTNAVKHFKFEQRGKRRLHSKPNGSEIEACRWWIDRELEIVQPKLVLALGATAARSLIGETMAIGKSRGRPHALAGGKAELWITVHPSYLLRLPDAVDADAERARFVEDLRMVRERLAEIGER